MKKEDLLKKMQMPPAKKDASTKPGDDMLAMDELDFEVEPMDAEMDSEEAPGPLADISDDDLLAEFKKRGLKLEAEPKEDGEEEDEMQLG